MLAAMGACGILMICGALWRLIDRKEGYEMLVNFLNSFMSYLVLLLIIVAVAGVATAIGITMAKKKSANVGTSSDQGNHV